MALVRSCLIAVVVASLSCFAAAQQNSTAVAKYEPALDVTSMDRYGRSLCGLFPVFLRRMDQEQSDSSRSIFMEPLLKDAG